MDKPNKQYITKIIENILGYTLYNAYRYLDRKIGEELGDSIVIKVVDKNNETLYEEECLEQVDGILDTINNDELKQTVVSTTYIEDYYGNDHMPKKYRIKKPAILITVE